MMLKWVMRAPPGRRSLSTLRSVGIAGSSRAGSFNKQLAAIAGKELKSYGAVVKEIPLDGPHTLPIYNEDLEKASFPEAARLLKKDMESCDGWLIAAPEYNGSMTPLFVNAVAWASRGDDVIYEVFKAKVAAIVSTSPGGLGGLRSMNAYKTLLQNLGVNVVPTSVAVGSAFRAFNNNTIADPRTKASLDATLAQLVHLAEVAANPQACDYLKTLKDACAGAPGEYGHVPPS